MKKFNIGDRVRIGGKLGAICTIVDFSDGIYTVVDTNCTGYIESEYLYPLESEWVQIPLFDL